MVCQSPEVLRTQALKKGAKSEEVVYDFTLNSLFLLSLARIFHTVIWRKIFSRENVIGNGYLVHYSIFYRSHAHRRGAKPFPFSIVSICQDCKILYPHAREL